MCFFKCDVVSCEYVVCSLQQRSGPIKDLFSIQLSFVHHSCSAVWHHVPISHNRSITDKEIRKIISYSLQANISYHPLSRAVPAFKGMNITLAESQCTSKTLNWYESANCGVNCGVNSCELNLIHNKLDTQ